MKIFRVNLNPLFRALDEKPTASKIFVSENQKKMKKYFSVKNWAKFLLGMAIFSPALPPFTRKF